MNSLGAWTRSAAMRAALFTVCWLAIIELDPSIVPFGLAAVPVATAVSLLMTGGPGSRAPRPRQVVAGIALAVWVLWRSVVGGVDVARRALTIPRPDIAPYWTEYRVSLESTAARVAFALIANLAPGTLTASLEGDRLDVHVISPDIGVEDSLASLERRLAEVTRR